MGNGTMHGSGNNPITGSSVAFVLSMEVLLREYVSDI